MYLPQSGGGCQHYRDLLWDTHAGFPLHGCPVDGIYTLMQLDLKDPANFGVRWVSDSGRFN